MAWIATLASAAYGAYASSKANSSSSSSGYTKAQKALLANLISNVSAGLSNSSNASPSTYIDMTDQEQAYINYVNNLANSRSTYLEGLANGSNLYTIDSNTANAYFENVIKANMSKAYANEQTDIAKAYSGATYWGTDRMAALSNAASNYSTDLSSAYANLMYSEELARREALENAANRAINAYSTLSSANEGIAGMLANTGTLERNVEESYVSDLLSRYLSGEKVTDANGASYYNYAYNPNVNLALSLLGLGGTTSTTSGNGTYAVLSGIANWASSANWSDIINSFKSSNSNGG